MACNEDLIAGGEKAIPRYCEDCCNGPCTNKDAIYKKPAALTPPLGGKVPSALDTQEGGDHYKKLGDYQPWQVLAKWMTPEELKGFAKGTAIAYLAREADKGGRLDIKKAMHTLQLYLELTEE